MRISRPKGDPDAGSPPRRNERFAGARDLRYEEMFGAIAQVLHERDPHSPHVDVYLFAPEKQKREFCTMVTSGMSDRKMDVPEAIGDCVSRAELIFYCREPSIEYANMLREIAHYPHDKETWLGHGHTLRFGKLLHVDERDAQFAGYLFLPSPIGEDGQLAKRLRLDGTPVNLLWVVPITEEELQLAEEEGTRALLRVLFDHGHPFVFDPMRESYIRNGKVRK